MGLSVLGYQYHLLLPVLPVVTKYVPISPRFSPSGFVSLCKFSTLTKFVN